METRTNNNWGGRRAGAGRPGSDKRKRTFYINEHEYQQLRSYLEQLRAAAAKTEAQEQSAGGTSVV
jgi:hypothetical protein